MSAPSLFVRCAKLTTPFNSVAVFEATPPSMAGTVGAIFNCALQLGAAVGISAVTSIETSIERKFAEGFSSYEGRRAAYWYIFAMAAILLLATGVFYRSTPQATEPESNNVDKAWMEKHKNSMDGQSVRLQENERRDTKQKEDANEEEDLGEIKLASEASGYSNV